MRARNMPAGVQRWRGGWIWVWDNQVWTWRSIRPGAGGCWEWGRSSYKDGLTPLDHWSWWAR